VKDVKSSDHPVGDELYPLRGFSELLAEFLGVVQKRKRKMGWNPFSGYLRFLFLAVF
jgi:hypothetical protein